MNAFIRHTAALLLAMGGVLLCGPQLRAQGKGVGEDSLAFRSLLLRLCEATAMEKQMENAVAVIAGFIARAELPELDTPLIADRLRCADIVRAVEPIYRGRFTREELLDVVLFFECPEVRSRYRILARDGASRFFLGNDLTREKSVLIEACTVPAAAPGTDIWFDLQQELRPLVSREIVLLVRRAFRAGIDSLYGKLIGPDVLYLTSEQIRADAARIPSKKYADIVRCLKGAGFRDFLVMTWFQSIEDGTLGNFGGPMSAESLEWWSRFTEQMAARMNEDTLIAVIAPVFHEFFTDREMKLLADFYQTKAGKGYVRIKLRQYREPEKLTDIFLEEFDKLSSKEQDRLIAFRETTAADKFIAQSRAMSDALYDRIDLYLNTLRRETYVDLIEDADSNE